MNRQRKRKFAESAARNSATYWGYFDRLAQIYMSSIEFPGLPETVDQRYMMRQLLMSGKCIGFEDDALGVVVLSDTSGGRLDVYGYPMIRRAQSEYTGQYFGGLNSSNSVIIYNDLMRTTPVNVLSTYAERLANIDRTIDTNVNAQRTPIMILCEENQKLTMENLYMQYAGNQPVIFGASGLNLNGIHALNTGAPYVSGELYELKVKIWNEALTYIGIPNVSEQKKERLIKDEVERGQGGTIACRFSRMDALREGWEKMNEMFGLNVKPRFKNFENPDESEGGAE